ncbi:MaoC family dehydratase [Castellaniella sp.]|uniref:MaoC family dehydratase n=1 Tax=Castellaniella sp. TaxID=1955812 RepID=UPI0035633084
MSSKNSSNPIEENRWKSRWSAAGYQYPARRISHGADWQKARLLASDVDSRAYGHFAEPGLFGLDCFDAMVSAGHDIDGYIFLSQSLSLHRLPRLDEALSLCGTVEELTPVPRGMMARECYQFLDASGKLCLETHLIGIVEPLGDALSDDAIGHMPVREQAPADGWTMIGEKQITPEKVIAFSKDVGNDLHFDPEMAQHYGFRAPLAQGVMTVVYLLSALSENTIPSGFKAQVDFLRPVFWDSTATLWIHGKDHGPSDTVWVQSRNEENKATANLIVKQLSYD